MQQSNLFVWVEHACELRGERPLPFENMRLSQTCVLWEQTDII